MAILITGGQGFVGSHLTNYLKKNGREFILLEKDLTKREAVLGFNSERSIEAVIHLAGIISDKDKQAFQRVNVEGTRHVVELTKKLGVKKLVFVSTLRALGAVSDPYVDSKRQAEKLVVESGLDYVILRPSIIYGPGEDKNISRLVRLMKKLPVVPVFNFYLQPIHVSDVVEAISKCLEITGRQIINIAGRETINYVDLIKLLKTKGCRIRTINAPRFFAWLLKIFSFLPFSPLTNWQVSTLLAGEVFPEYHWCEQLDIKGVSFSDGLDNLLKNL